MVGTLGIPKSALLLEARTRANANTNGDFPKSMSMTVSSKCSSNEEDQKIPKLESFSRSKMERALKDPPLIQKSLHQLSDYCTVLEGESSYSCWQAYFEFQDLQKEYSKEEMERLIIEAEGVKSLIGCLHGVASIRKENKQFRERDTKQQTQQQESEEGKHMHIPDGLPMTAQQVEEEENAKMPDSAYTRLLRLAGTHPAWYSPTPDHQSD